MVIVAKRLLVMLRYCRYVATNNVNVNLCMILDV